MIEIVEDKKKVNKILPQISKHNSKTDKQLEQAKKASTNSD